MCGRYSLSPSGETLATAFQLDSIPLLEPRYNIAPTQPVSTMVATKEQPRPHYQLLRWGLIPSWAKNPAIGHRLINARSETVAEKPSFRAAFKRRRCLILADGFYEWQRQPDQKTKQPFHICLTDHRPFALAGLWEHWIDSLSGSELQTCTILTTVANPLVQPIHNRMPVILAAEDYQPWLDPDYYNVADLQAMLRPFPETQMQAYPVSRAVNNPHHDGPDCLEPLATQA